MAETCRLFIATELPDPVKDVLAGVQERLQQDHPPVKWVAREAMHLTLQFLGRTEAVLLPQIGAALRAAVAGLRAHELRLGACGAFPNIRRPSVLWVSVGGATAVLEEIQAAIAAALEPLGFARETRPFHPHLTIGRVRREVTPAEQQRLGGALSRLPALPAISWRVERVVVMRSDLLRSGPRYTACDAVSLTP